MHRTPPPIARLAAAASATALVAGLAIGCTNEGRDAPGPDGPRENATSDAEASDAGADGGMLATITTIGTVTGPPLGDAERTELRGAVSATVDAWFDAAFLGGDYPRTDFDDAFEVFTEQAQARARADRGLMSNAAVGTTTHTVRALARRAVIDVLSGGRGPAAVTVRFRLGMARGGESGAELDERLSGRLFLTREPGTGWRVFGYDVQRGAIR